jgi:ATP synthase F1 complex assembly factor 1
LIKILHFDNATVVVKNFKDRSIFFFFIDNSTQPCFSALSLQPNLQKLQERAIPGDFVKWASLGFYRTSSFASGFTPLQQKPLDSIMDIERVKDRSPENITSIWDDVMSQILKPMI